MRAVTWTQVAQYIILIVAYLIPVVWLSVKQTSVPVPQAGLRLPAGEGDGPGDEADRRSKGASKCASSSSSGQRRFRES